MQRVCRVIGTKTGFCSYTLTTVGKDVFCHEPHTLPSESSMLYPELANRRARTARRFILLSMQPDHVCGRDRLDLAPLLREVSHAGTYVPSQYRDMFSLGRTGNQGCDKRRIVQMAF